jgi:hypothetical protein
MTSHTDSTLEKEYNAAKKAVADLAPSVTKARKRTKRALDEKKKYGSYLASSTKAITKLKRGLELSKKNEPDPPPVRSWSETGQGRKCEKCGKKPLLDSWVARTPGYYFSHYSDYCCRDCYIENMAERKSGKGLSVCLECEKEERTSLLVFDPILIPDRTGYKKKGKKKTCNLCGTSDLTHLPEQGWPGARPVHCLYCHGDLSRVEIFPSKVVKGRVFCHYCKDSEIKANSHLGKHRTAKKRREDELRKELIRANVKLGETESSSKDAETKYLDLRSKRSSLEKELEGKKKARDDLHDRILLVKKRKADKVAAKREAKRKAEEAKRKAEEAKEAKRKRDKKAKRKAERKAEEAKEAKRKAEMDKAKRDREKRLRENKKQLKLLNVSDKLLGLINDEGTVDLSIVSQIHKEDWVQQSPSSDGMDAVIDYLLNKTGNDKLTIKQGKYLNLHREHNALLKVVVKDPRKFDWAKSRLDDGFSISWQATEAIVGGMNEDLARDHYDIKPIRKPEPKPKPKPKPKPNPKPIPKPINKNGGGKTRPPPHFIRRDEE